MVKKKKGLVLTLVALLSLIAITVGVTYAFFNYQLYFKFLYSYWIYE